jgi:multidrug efflux pump
MNIEFLSREITIGAPATQWWISLSTAIVFGLCFATVLTLIVTPAALMAIENLRAWRLRVGAALRRWMPAFRRVRPA